MEYQFSLTLKFIIIILKDQKQNYPKMFHPYQTFFDSYYYYAMTSTPSCFNYDLYQNTPKILSTIILTQNQHKTIQTQINEEKTQDIHFDSSFSPKQQNFQNLDMIKKDKKNEKIQKQVCQKKPRKSSKQIKKIDLVQKQGRNSHSNILRKFFKLLSVKIEFKGMVDKIIDKHGFSTTVDDYFNKIKEKNIDHRNYIRVKQMEWLVDEKNNQTSKITRILFQDYLKNYYIQHLLSSRKTDSKSIIYHLKGKRTIQSQLFNKQDQQQSQSSHQQ